MNWNISIKDYMGRVGDGILTLVTLVIDSTAYDITYWYNNEKCVVTITDALKDKLNVSDIEEHSHYEGLLVQLKKLTVPHAQMINSIDDLDLSKYVPQDLIFGEHIDESEITVGTQSNT
jgi:hypothetical protein